MATHFICQPTEPLPHKFSLDHSPEKSHGAVSDYELLNLRKKIHTEFPPPGWDTSQSSEESLPLCSVPVPAWKITRNLMGPDPQLCVTPEKPTGSRVSVIKNSRNQAPVPTKLVRPVLPDPDLCITPEKSIASKLLGNKQNLQQDADANGKKVRFDVQDSDDFTQSTNTSLSQDSFLFQKGKFAKPYQPNNYCEQEFDDESEPRNYTGAKTKKYKVENYNNTPVYVALADHNVGEINANDKKLENRNLEKNTECENVTSYEPVLPMFLNQQGSGKERTVKIQPKSLSSKTSKSNEKIKDKSQSDLKSDSANIPASKSIQKRKVRVTRETKEKPELTDYVFPFSEEGAGAALEYEHVFLRPEYNSTLKIRREIEEIKSSSVDVVKALEKKLKVSETTKSDIKEKAASKVNATDPHFRGLVSLEIPIEDVCSQVEKSQMLKSKPVTHKSKSQIQKDREPDLLEFFTPDLQREFPELSTPGLSLPSECLSTASQMNAFDLYRHNRVWDNTSYFKSYVN